MALLGMGKRLEALSFPGGANRSDPELKTKQNNKTKTKPKTIRSDRTCYLRREDKH